MRRMRKKGERRKHSNNTCNNYTSNNSNSHSNSRSSNHSRNSSSNFATVGLDLNSAAIHDVSYDSLSNASEFNAF